MAMPMHRVEKVDPVSVWPDGPEAFSQWLIENVDLLSEQLPFDLHQDSLVRAGAIDETPIDIIGDAVDPTTGDSIKVVIQNQITRTDHDHLGRVVASAAAYGAGAAIWISTGATAAHVDAVQWMNDESTLDAWLFDVEVIRIADSPAAALLAKIVGPATPLAEGELVKRPTRNASMAREEFWAVALPKVMERCQPFDVWQGLRPQPGDHYSELVPGAPNPAIWQLGVSPRGSYVCLRLDAGSSEEGQFYFRQLLAQRPEVDEEFGGNLSWKLRASARTLEIRWENSAATGYKDEPASWGMATDLLADAMARLAQATKSRVQALERFHASAHEDHEAMGS